MSLILDRYPITYRRSIVETVITVTQQGGCLCLVGLAGVGKSNLVHFMEQPEVRAFYLPHSEAERTHLLGVACGTGVCSAGLVYQPLFSPLLALARQLGIPVTKASEGISYDDLRNLLKLVCRQYKQRIVFVLDEFENLIRNQPLELFENLRVLRDDHRSTGNLAYIILTHRMPQVVVGNQPFADSRLFEIIRDAIHPLGPYCREDALAMLDTLRVRSSLTISPINQDRLCVFSGGHSGLMRAIFMAIRPNFDTSARKIIQLAKENSTVQNACEHIWEHLHTEEQSALLGLVVGTSPNLTMTEFLIKRGLLTTLQNPAFFSPVFEGFVKGLKSQ